MFFFCKYRNINIFSLDSIRYRYLQKYWYSIYRFGPPLFTGKDCSEMLVLSTEAQNCAVLDAFSSTVCWNKEWLSSYFNSLDEEARKNVQKSSSQKVFRFDCRILKFHRLTADYLELHLYPCMYNLCYLNLRIDNER